MTDQIINVLFRPAMLHAVLDFQAFFADFRVCGLDSTGMVSFFVVVRCRPKSLSWIGYTEGQYSGAKFNFSTDWASVPLQPTRDIGTRVVLADETGRFCLLFSLFFV